MKKFILGSFLVLLCSCQSKFTKLTNEMYDLVEEYTDALDNAKSQEEIKFLKEEFERKGELIEDKFDELQKSDNYSLDDIQSLMQDGKLKKLVEQAKEAERNAYNRCKE